LTPGLILCNDLAAIDFISVTSFIIVVNITGHPEAEAELDDLAQSP
jgi:hypothetical protein